MTRISRDNASCRQRDHVNEAGVIVNKESSPIDSEHNLEHNGTEKGGEKERKDEKR